MLDSFKKLLGIGSKHEKQSHQMELIKEEMDEYERELQEYISYTRPEPLEGTANPPAPSQPDVLSTGGAVQSSSLITPEEKKRIENS